MHTFKIISYSVIIRSYLSDYDGLTTQQQRGYGDYWKQEYTRILIITNI